MNWRSVTRIVLLVNALIALVTAVNFVPYRSEFPVWFAPVFLIVLGVFVVVILLYVYELGRLRDALKSPSDRHTTAAWVLLISSVVCTAALHKFFPFRPQIFGYWPHASLLLRYNFILTAASLLLVIVFALLYQNRGGRPAIIGLMMLAVWMVIPNDDCGNPFNKPWVQWLGASPLMFMPNSVVLLVGCCCLHDLRPRASLVVMALINAFVLLLGLGHLTGVVW